MRQLEFDELLDKLITPIELIYARVETSLLKDIAMRFKNYETTGGILEWRIQKLDELGALNKETVQRIANLSNKPYKEIKRAIQEVTGKTIDLELYQTAYKQGFININPTNVLLTRVLQERYSEVEDMVQLIHNTMISSTKQQYLQIVDKVYLEVATGSKSHTEALRDAIVELGDKGISGATYKRKNGSTYNMSIEPVVRRNLITTLVQASNEASHHYITQLGVEQIYVSQHIGARNKGSGTENHEKWQGKIYNEDEFVEKTGFRTMLGLGGINCRHNHYPYFKGLSLPPDERVDTKENTRLYDLIQKQRKMERDIRKAKKRVEIFKTVEDANMLKAGKQDLTNYNKKISQFIKDNPELVRDKSREMVQ